MNSLRNILISGLFPVFFFFLAANVAGQTKEENHLRHQNKNKKAKTAAETGDQHFRNYEYYLAAQEYLTAVNEDPEYIYAIYHLAESYRLYFNYDKAQKYYLQVLDKDPSAYPLSRYWYAVTLKNRGEYEIALENFEQFIEEISETDQDAATIREKARLDAEGCKLAMHELKKPVRNYHFKVLPTPVNSPSSEFSPAIYENDSALVLSSARSGTVGDKDFGMLGGKFTDNFRFQKGEGKDQWAYMSNSDNFAIVNSEFNESSGSFTSDKKKFYFTRCDDKVIVGDFEEFNCAIYVTEKHSGKWSQPKKLNENINVKGQWNAQPSVSPKGDTLFFVSKRDGGLGMHDVYYSVSSGKDDWSPAVNLGEGINTPYIDMSPCYYSKEATLFFSSNGHNGFGGLDIMKASGEGFKAVENLGLPFNSNMDDFYFVLGEEKGYLASNRQEGSGNDDIYMFNIRSEEAIVAEVNKDSLLAQAERDSLGEVKSISIVGTVLHEDSKEPAADVENKLKDKEGKVIKTTKTNEEGNFRFDNLPPDDYKVEVEDKNAKLTSEVEYIVEDVHIKTSGKEVSKVLFENIYFDFDRYKLRREARKVLRELAAYCKKYPEIQIEMNASTDSYGSDEYNKVLSLNRGNAALEYLIGKGVDKSSLVVNALGEDKPIATNTNAAGRQLNRRVEFYILGGPGYEAKAMTYIADPNATLAEIAQKFGMTIEELKELNDIDDDSVRAYQPVRVRRTADDDIIAPVTMALVKPSKGASNSRYQLNESNPEKYRSSIHSEKGSDFYVVAPKNTLFSIARLFGMSLDELKHINGLTSDTIFKGQRLHIKTLTPSMVHGNLYLVKNGDTIASIAKRFGIAPEELVRLNGMEGYKLYQNMVLRIK